MSCTFFIMHTFLFSLKRGRIFGFYRDYLNLRGNKKRIGLTRPPSIWLGFKSLVPWLCRLYKFFFFFISSDTVLWKKEWALLETNVVHRLYTMQRQQTYSRWFHCRFESQYVDTGHIICTEGLGSYQNHLWYFWDNGKITWWFECETVNILLYNCTLF